MTEPTNSTNTDSKVISSSESLFTPNRQNILPHFQSPELARMDHLALSQRFKESIQLIRVKDQDLKLASEIGSSLLVNSQQLQRENEELQSKLLNCKANDSAESAHIDRLEKQQVAMQSQFEQDRREFDEFKAISQKTIKQLQLDLSVAREESSSVHDRLVECERHNHKLVEERLHLQQQQQIHQSKQSATSLLPAAGSVDRGEQFEQALLQLTAEKEAIELELTSTNNSLVEALEQNEHLKLELEEMHRTADEIATKTIELEHLQCALEETQEILRQLTSAKQPPNETTTSTSSLTSSSAHASSNPSRTLFAEVEDQRVELEHRQFQLATKHLDLLRKYQESIQQQDRMKNHIARLTQLSSSTSDDAKVKRMEHQLVQLQSENQLLRSRVVALERDCLSSAAGSFTDSDPTYYNNQTMGMADKYAGGDSSVYLKQIGQLQMKLEKLRKETRTLSLLRLDESEKCRDYERQLTEKESENRVLRNQLAQIQFDVDEMRLNAKLAAHKDDDDDAAARDDSDSSIDFNPTTLTTGHPNIDETERELMKLVQLKKQMDPKEENKENSTDLHTYQKPAVKVSVQLKTIASDSFAIPTDSIVPSSCTLPTGDEVSNLVDGSKKQVGPVKEVRVNRQMINNDQKCAQQ